jgi:hypothetical protein
MYCRSESCATSDPEQYWGQNLAYACLSVRFHLIYADHVINLLALNRKKSKFERKRLVSTVTPSRSFVLAQREMEKWRSPLV